MTFLPLLRYKVQDVYDRNWKDWTVACFKESWQHIPGRTEEDQDKRLRITRHRPKASWDCHRMAREKNRNNGDKIFMVTCRLYRVAQSCPYPQSVFVLSAYFTRLAHSHTDFVSPILLLLCSWCVCPCVCATDTCYL